MAVALGREMQESPRRGHIFQGQHETHFSKPLCRRLPEFADEVGQMALELAGRRPQPGHAIERKKQWRERQASLHADWIRRTRNAHDDHLQWGHFCRRAVRMRSPAEDGPSRRVPDDFQAAVLDGAALQPLVATNPEVAREVLLAVCIEEPRREDAYNDRMFLIGRCGLEDWRHGYPAMYWKGPFLAFLGRNPKRASKRSFGSSITQRVDGSKQRPALMLPKNAEAASALVHVRRSNSRLVWRRECVRLASSVVLALQHRRMCSHGAGKVALRGARC